MNSKKYIPLASPNTLSNDIDTIVSLLNPGNLIHGKYIESIENKINEFPNALNLYQNGITMPI
jgi:hypothetical protein